VSFHVFKDNVVKTFVATTASIDADPEQEPLQVLKDQHTNKSHSNDDEDQYHIE
jgi:hypothetical protein